jgi:hemolysin activation/secretion protein
MMNRSVLAGAALALSAGLPTAFPALAAGPTPAYNAGTAVHEAERPKAPVDKPAPVPVLPGAEEQPFTLPDGGTVLVREFRLDGLEPLEEAEVQAVLAPYRGRELSLTEIYEAASKVSNLYRERGFMMAKAYVPRQDAGGGTLLITVVVGRHGGTSIDNASPVLDFLVAGAFEDATRQGQPIERDKVERAMLLVSDMPGAQMPTVTSAAGAAPGTTDFMVKVEPASRISGYALVDNQGSRYTGRDRLNLGLDLNAPLGLADKLSLSGMTAEGAALQNGRAAYSVPLSFDGLRLEVAASRTTYKLGDTYRDLEATGVATIYEASLSYPLLRSSAESLSLWTTAAAKRLQDKQAGETIGSKRSKVVTVGARNQTTGTLFGFDLVTDLSPSLTFGDLKIPDASLRAANRAGVNTIGAWSKANLSMAGTLAFTRELSLTASLKGQKALMDKNLDGSEQMSVSGAGGVRSYVEGVLGDNGYLFNVEAKYTLPALGDFGHAVGLFSDSGRAYYQDRDYTTDRNGTRITDVGLGYYANYQYGDGRYLVGKLHLAHSVGQQAPVGEKNARTKLLGQFGLTF